ncbi:MAG TPA: DUF6314 family protein [Streptosporangiaceae bacterium]|nr:DUF6314 family protein [Streptosporangiaceae bacterium]
MGVDESRVQQGVPVRPPPRAGGETIEFLRGDWDVERRITDRRAGQDGVFSGTARFRPAAGSPAAPDSQVSAGAQLLDYTEDGELRFGSHRGPARRSLIYAGRQDGAADVRFADGREFYRLDLRAGTWQADHPCRADRYHVTVTRHGADSFTETWQVVGPDKDYELETTYRRVVDGVLGTGPQGRDVTVSSQPGGLRCTGPRCTGPR